MTAILLSQLPMEWDYMREPPCLIPNTIFTVSEVWTKPHLVHVCGTAPKLILGKQLWAKGRQFRQVALLPQSEGDAACSTFLAKRWAGSFQDIAYKYYVAHNHRLESCWMGSSSCLHNLTLHPFLVVKLCVDLCASSLGSTEDSINDDQPVATAGCAEESEAGGSRYRSDNTILASSSPLWITF